MAKFDASKLSRRDWVVAVTAVVALISLFLPWYGWTSGPYSASVSGFSTGYGWLGGLLIVVAGAFLVALRSGVDVSRLPLSPAVAVAGASVIGTVLVVIRWAGLPRGHAGIGGTTLFSYGPRVGIILTIIAGVAQAVVAVLEFRASGEKLPWAK